jgi:hypothetical protein
MKDQIQKLTEGQAKYLLGYAMAALQTAVYATEHLDRMNAAQRFGEIVCEIELKAEGSES